MSVHFDTPSFLLYIIFRTDHDDVFKNYARIQGFSDGLIIEGGAAEEFAEQGGGGNLVGRDRFEITEEFHEPVGL